MARRCSASSVRCMLLPARCSCVFPAMEGVRWAFSCGTWLPSRADWLLAVRSIQPEEKERIGQFVFARDAKAAMVGARGCSPGDLGFGVHAGTSTPARGCLGGRFLRVHRPGPCLEAMQAQIDHPFDVPRKAWSGGTPPRPPRSLHANSTPGCMFSYMQIFPILCCRWGGQPGITLRQLSGFHPQLWALWG